MGAVRGAGKAELVCNSGRMLKEAGLWRGKSAAMRSLRDNSTSLPARTIHEPADVAAKGEKGHEFSRVEEAVRSRRLPPLKVPAP